MAVPGLREAILVEFSALRAEISQRSTAQNTFVGLSLTLSGILFTAIAITSSDGEPPAALLAVPFLSLSFGLLWIDHSVAIRGIADYIDQILAPKLSIDVGADVLEWERSASMIAGRRLPIVLRMAAATYFVFALPGAVSLVATISLLPVWNSYQRALWIAALAIQVCFAWVFFKSSKSLS